MRSPGVSAVSDPRPVSCNWGNSLRAPVVSESTFKIPVQVCPVDDVLLELGISRVDFIKLDVEGPNCRL
jgi:hypothetical protein